MYWKNFYHYLCLIASGYILGLLSFHLLPTKTALYISVILFIIVHISTILAVKNYFDGKGIKLYLLIAFFFISVISGNLRLMCFNHTNYSILNSFEGEKAVYLCKITSAPKKTNDENTVNVSGTVYSISNAESSFDVSINVNLYLKQSSYNKVSLNDDIKFYHTYEKETSDNLYAKSKNQLATFYISKYVKTNDKAFKPSLSYRFKILGAYIRTKILFAVEKVFEYNKQSSAIVKAILTGDKDGFSDYLYNALSDAGFLHVAAISGTHVSILFSFLAIMLSSVNLSKKLQIFISAAVILIYSSVSEFTPSVLRASIMLIVFMLSTILDREYHSLTALFFSAVVILIIYPYALFSAGFLLSFGATLGIVVFYSLFLKHFRSIFKKLSGFLPLESISLSVSAFIGTLPFTLFFFQKLSFWSTVTNIWILPIVSVILCTGFLSAIFYYICPFISFNVLRYITEPFIYVLIWTAKTFSSLKFGIISFDYIPWFTYIYYVLFFFMLLYALKLKSKKAPIDILKSK